MQNNYVVFGPSGFLGSAIVRELRANPDNRVIEVRHSELTRQGTGQGADDWIGLLGLTEIHGVVWAQGLNSSGGILEESAQSINSVFEANVLYIVETLQAMLRKKVFSQSPRLVIIGSVWQEFTRPKKLSYLLSKTALNALVPSLAADLGEFNVAVNAVLPGVVESPMTRERLTREQILAIEAQTPGNKLASAGDVARSVVWLLSTGSSGVNGQCLIVDNGWSKIRYV